MENRAVIGLEARTSGGEVIGRISEVVFEGDTDVVTHLIVETGDEDERVEIPLSAVTLDEDADFATFHADRLDEEPGDHLGDEETPEGYAPLEVEDGGPDDSEAEGQFVTLPGEEEDEISPKELAREDWTEEEDTPDSGFPRNDAYIDPDTGEEEIDPALKDNENAGDDVADLLADTDITVESYEDGVVVLGGKIESQRDLTELLAEVMGIDGVLGVDSGDVEVGA